MIARRGGPVKVAAVAAALLAGCAGCGTAARQARASSSATVPAAPLASSLATAGGTWAVVPMGGSPAFWQLVRAPAGGRWALVTPPGVATNGGLVIAALGGRSLIGGIRPSRYLAYSPLAVTADGGTTWSPGILDARLADVPDALAASTGNQVLALLSGGTVMRSASPAGASGWTQLTSEHAIAATAAGRGCGITALTAVAFSGPGVPLLGGRCARPGVAGVFAMVDGSWRAAAPVLPASLAGRTATVLRLATAGARTVVLLAVGAGPAAVLLAAWTSDGGAHWALSPPLATGGAGLRSSGLGSAGAVVVVLGATRGQLLGGPGAGWRPLPTLPAGTLALVAGPGGVADALAARGTKLTDWRLAPAGGGWRAAQTISVPIQFGSSG